MKSVNLLKGDTVELVLADRGKYWNISNHPMHIHGQHVYVIAMGQVGINPINLSTSPYLLYH